MWGRVALRGLASARFGGRKVVCSDLRMGRKMEMGGLGGVRTFHTTGSDLLWKGTATEGLREQTVRVGQRGVRTTDSPAVLKDWEKYQPEKVEKEEEEIRGKQDKAALEYKNARILFNHVWQTIEMEWGPENLKFPKEIIWLMGAPGAGKG